MREYRGGFAIQGRFVLCVPDVVRDHLLLMPMSTFRDPCVRRCLRGSICSRLAETMPWYAGSAVVNGRVILREAEPVGRSGARPRRSKCEARGVRISRSWRRCYCASRVRRDCAAESNSEHDFDEYVEEPCQRFYADVVGRPGLPPGRYFRLLLIGYFEGLDAERAIAWRAADSLRYASFSDWYCRRRRL